MDVHKLSTNIQMLIRALVINYPCMINNVDFTHYILHSIHLKLRDYIRYLLYLHFPLEKITK
jgi:hypothetical protein